MINSYPFRGSGHVPAAQCRTANGSLSLMVDPSGLSPYPIQFITSLRSKV